MTAGRRRYNDDFYCAIDHAKLRSNVYAAEDWPATPRKASPAPRPQERRVAAVKEKPTGPVSIPPQIIVKDPRTLLVHVHEEEV